MTGNEFKEWPDVHAPGGAHGARVTKTYDFPLTEEDRLAGEGASRGLSVSVIRRDSYTDIAASWSVSPRSLQSP